MFLSDEPIGRIQDDLLDRGQFVDHLSKGITSWKFKQPLVIGLHGDWGKGKSSVVNLVYSKLQKRKGLILIKFDPWYFNTEEALIKNYFSTIENRLKKQSGLRGWLINLQNNFSLGRYKNLLSVGAALSPHPILSKLLSFFSSTREGETPEELKANLNRYFKNLKKKVVVLIDNIDRLDKEEIRLIFKLVKLCSNFKNFVYLLAFDKNYVTNALKSEFEADKEFLYKIVQVDLALPKVDSSKIDSFINAHFEDLIKIQRIKLENDFEGRFPLVYSEHIKKVIKTLRDAKRYLNGLAITLPQVKGEVNYADFLIIEFLRIFYPEVHTEIFDNKDLFANFDSGYTSYSSDRERQARHEFYKEFFKLFPDKTTQTIVKGLVSTIFPLVDYYLKSPNTVYTSDWSLNLKKKQRVASPDCFDRYFLLKVPPEEISDTAIRAFIRTLNKTNIATIPKLIEDNIKKFQKEKRSIEFFDKLIVFIDELSPRTYRAIIKTLWELSDSFSNERKLWMSSEADRARALMWVLLKHYEKRPAIQKILLEIVKNAKSLHFAAAIVHFSKEDVNKIISKFDKINLNELRNALTKRIDKELIKPLKNIYKAEPKWAGFILNQIGNKTKVTDYTIAIWKKNDSYIGKVLSRYVLKWESKDKKRWQFDYKALSDMFEVDRIYKIVRKKRKKLLLNKVEKWAVGKFIELYGKEKKK